MIEEQSLWPPDHKGSILLGQLKKGHRPYGLCPFFVTPHGLEPLLFCHAKQEQFAA